MLPGKTVRVSDPQLLQFFYPSFVVRERLGVSALSEDVIYVGPYRPQLLKWLRLGTRSFINTVGVPELDLTDRHVLLSFVFSRHGKIPSKSAESMIDSLDDQQFLNAVKIAWVSGVWPVKDQGSESMFSFFQSMAGSLKENLMAYFKLLESTPYYVVEASLLTFLVRAVSLDEQNVSPAYRRCLQAFVRQSGSKIRQAVWQFARRGDLPDDLRLLELILSLR